MFYKFIDNTGSNTLVNINRISHIYEDSSNFNLYHIILVDDLEGDIEIDIDYNTFKDFESWLKLCRLN